VREFADKICHEEVTVDILINNAGVYNCPYQLTEDGLEMQMGVNHFGHFLLVNLLLDKLKASVPSRIIIVSSGLHKLGHIDFDNLHGKKGYSAKDAYRNSKLANNLFARELARRTSGSGISVHCVRPGMVRTELGRHVQFNPVIRFLAWPLAWLLVKSPKDGCQTIVHCAVAEELHAVTGHFYANCAEEPWTQVSLDDQVAARLWLVSEQVTGLRPAVSH
jgi:retinol dehydrogenase-14